MEIWWAVDQAFWWGVVGGGLGTVLGVGGAIVGGYLLPRGRGYRGVVVGLVAVGIGGLLGAVAGVAAIADDQPFVVYYPLLLLGCIAYWVAVGLLPQIDMAYRVVLANGGTGARLEPPGRPPAVRPTAPLLDDWRPQGRYGKWVRPLIAGHALAGSIILVWGAWRFLIGAESEGWLPGMMIGVGFLTSAGHLWMVKALGIRGFAKPGEQQRLAAEELRRS